MFLSVVKKPKYKTNSMFSICLVVACGPLGHGCEKLQETKHFFWGEVCYKRSSFLMMNADKWGGK